MLTDSDASACESSVCGLRQSIRPPAFDPSTRLRVETHADRNEARQLGGHTSPSLPYSMSCPTGTRQRESPMLHHSPSASAKPEQQLPDEERRQRKNIISFGPFRLFATERLLEKDGVPLNLGSRALDLLIALVERATEVVSKRELMARVWPNLVVDEGSLRFHIASLRKVLGDGQSGVRYVTNIAGRGYCFVAPISRSAAQPPRAESFAADQAAKLLSRLLRMVGRDETVQTISA